MADRARHWQRLVEAWARSGLSQLEFCRRRGVKLGAFGWWKRRLRGVTPKVERVGRRQRSAVPRRADFVELTLPQRFRATLASQSAGSEGWGGYEIVFRNGHVIRVLQPFDAVAVVPLIAAVASC
jgi:hypothetical protein